MKNIQTIAKECRIGDTITNDGWANYVTAEIVEINNEGVLLKSEHMNKPYHLSPKIHIQFL